VTDLALIGDAIRIIDLIGEWTESSIFGD